MSNMNILTVGNLNLRNEIIAYDENNTSAYKSWVILVADVAHLPLILPLSPRCFVPTSKNIS